MKKIVLALFTLVVVISFASCGEPSYKDGSYEGESISSSNKHITKVNITLKDGVITECSAEFLDQNEKAKDEHYGEDMGEANFVKAQTAVKGMVQYPDKMVEAGKLEMLEAVSGATISYKEFKNAVTDALSKAE